MKTSSYTAAIAIYITVIAISAAAIAIAAASPANAYFSGIGGGGMGVNVDAMPSQPDYMQMDNEKVAAFWGCVLSLGTNEAACTEFNSER